MLNGLIAQLKLKIDAILHSAICVVVASAAGVIAVVFFCAAGFVRLAQDYGTVTTCLMFGGAFVLIALIAVIVMIVLRRRHEKEARRQAARLAQMAALASAVDLTRALGGGRRGVSLALVGAFLVGLMLSRSTPKRED